MPATVLATGGAGYVGSHVVAALLAAGFRVVVLDNFATSRPETIRRINAISPRPVVLVEGDIRDGPTLDALFGRHAIDAVVHLAGLKVIAESLARPLPYYAANVGGALNLLRAMQHHRVRRMVFSSSAAVYGRPDTCPVREDAPLRPASPYARSKAIIEQMIAEIAAADPAFAAISLRYFNPAGAHPSAAIGEAPLHPPGNLFPILAEVAAGRRAYLTVFGADHPTRDGTGVRDFIHVMDLAAGHVAALEFLLGPARLRDRALAINLGCGHGHSVLEVRAAFERASGRPIPYETAPPRPGDVPACVADPSLAADLLGWRARLGLAEMCADHWAFCRARLEAEPAADAP